MTARISKNEHILARHALRQKIIRIISALVTVHIGTVYRHVFHAAGKFCENELKACDLSDVYQHLFF